MIIGRNPWRRTHGAGRDARNAMTDESIAAPRAQDVARGLRPRDGRTGERVDFPGQFEHGEWVFRAELHVDASGDSTATRTMRSYRSNPCPNIDMSKSTHTKTIH
jgi:hypothetical protein